jgi:hypothetical protein
VCVLITTRLCALSPSLCDEVILAPIAAPLLAPTATLLIPTATLIPHAQPPLHAPAPLLAEHGARACVYTTFLAGGGDGSGGGDGGRGADIVHIRDSGVLAGAVSVQASAELLLALLTACPPHSALLMGLSRVGCDTALLRLLLYISAQGRKGLTVDSQLSQCVLELGLAYLKRVGTNATPLLLCLIFEPPTGGTFSVVGGLVEVRARSSERSEGAEGERVSLRESGGGEREGGDEGQDEESLLRAQVGQLCGSEGAASLLERVRAVAEVVNVLEEGYRERQVHAQAAKAMQTGAAQVEAAQARAQAAGTAGTAGAAGAQGGGKTAEGEGAGEGEGEGEGAECIGSALFLALLRGFLLGEGKQQVQEGHEAQQGPQGQEEQAQQTQAQEAQAQEAGTQEEQETGAGADRRRALSGVALVLLQSHVPFTTLLRSGEHSYTCIPGTTPTPCACTFVTDFSSYPHCFYPHCSYPHCSNPYRPLPPPPLPPHS